MNKHNTSAKAATATATAEKAKAEKAMTASASAVPTGTAVATVAPPVLTSVIRPMATLLSVFEENGDRLSIKPGTVIGDKPGQITAEEIAEVIADRQAKSDTFRVQARWAYYSAGLLPDGAEVQKQIANKLGTKLTTSALYQLKSEATSLIPRLVANQFASPISLLKDASAEIKFGDDGKALPDDKQTAAARELLPLLKSGELKQKQIRDIRKKHNAPTSAGTSPTTAGTPAAPGTTTPADREQAAYVTFLANLRAGETYLTSHKLMAGSDDHKMAVALVTNLARLLGHAVS